MIGRRRQHDVEVDVRVDGGMVRGVRERGLLAWRGIPYAAAPVGSRRFAAPGAIVPWEGIRDASEFGPIAPQALTNRLIRPPSLIVASAEDCLTVNVHAPISPEGQSAPLPVMVFIHGGGYSAGSSRDFSGHGEGFVRSGRVVYVSFNYRLGALGYLDFTGYSAAERSFESNLGLRDQVALLSWVQHNIGGFGGDPGNVTVFGESAGGNAVTTLMATPSARGLFARAIAQSSPPNAVYGRTMTARWAEEYVEILRGVVSARESLAAAAGDPGGRIAPGGNGDPDAAGDPGGNGDPDAAGDPGGNGDPDAAGDPGENGDPVGALDRSPHRLLADASPSDLVAASVALQVRVPDAYPGAFCFAPVVDGVFLPERPMRAFRDGRAHRVPLIIGTNDREGSIFRGRVDILPRTPARIDALFERAPAGARQAMRDAYPGLPARRPAADFGGDYGFWYPSTRVADFHSRRAPVWSYRFDVAPRLLELVGLDATHGVEMFALFDRTEEPLARVMTSFGGYEEYTAAGDRMRALWLWFVEDGRPGQLWPRYEERMRATLVIDDVDRIETDPRRARRRAWHRFIPALAG